MRIMIEKKTTYKENQFSRHSFQDTLLKIIVALQEHQNRIKSKIKQCLILKQTQETRKTVACSKFKK